MDEQDLSSKTCGVFGCPRQPAGSTFFQVPRPAKGQSICKRWLTSLGNPNYENMDINQIYNKYKSLLVCARHFKQEDFLTHNKLKENVVPTLHLPKPICIAETINVDPGPSVSHTLYVDMDLKLKENILGNFDDSSRKRRFPLPLRQDDAKRLFVETGEVMDIPKQISETCNFISPTEDKPQLGSPDICENSVACKGKMNSSKAVTLVMTRRKKLLNREALILYEKAKQLRHKAVKLKTFNVNFRRRLLDVQKICQSKALSNLINTMTPSGRRFFKRQLRNVTIKRNGTTFSVDDQIDAMILWISCPKLYRLLYNLFYLPPIRTLRALLTKVPVSAGISDTIFKRCKQQAESMKEKDKVCVILFDEMALQPHLVYEQIEDYIIGFEDNGFERNRNIADRVAVFMLRGIFKKWQQPVAFSFFKSPHSVANITRFYKEIVKKATEAGLLVIGSVCDQRINNVRAINLLQEQTRARAIRGGKEYKEGVIKIGNVEVVPLYDPPRLLKCLSNDLLTKNLKFSVNNVEKVASWEHIVKAYDIDKSLNIRVMRKLSGCRVPPHKVKKIKVAMASEIFSGTVASTIKYCALSGIQSADGTSKLDESAMDTAEFLEFVDKMFDSVNEGLIRADPGKHLREKVSAKSSHLRVWLNAVNVLKTIQFEADRKFPPCLRGWIDTLEGFVILRSKLFNLGYTSFCTRAFNLDPFEIFFGQLRQHRNVSPTCENFLHYFKSVLIKKNSLSLLQNSHCENDLLESNLVSLKHFLLKGN